MDVAHPHLNYRAEARLGLRREAERHAAFVRIKRVDLSDYIHPVESAVAAALCRRSPRSWFGFGSLLHRPKPTARIFKLGTLFNLCAEAA